MSFIEATAREIELRRKKGEGRRNGSQHCGMDPQVERDGKKQELRSKKQHNKENGTTKGRIYIETERGEQQERDFEVERERERRGRRMGGKSQVRRFYCAFGPWGGFKLRKRRRRGREEGEKGTTCMCVCDSWEHGRGEIKTNVLTAVSSGRGCTHRGVHAQLRESAEEEHTHTKELTINTAGGEMKQNGGEQVLVLGLSYALRCVLEARGKRAG